MTSTTATGRALIYDADCGFCTRTARWLSDGRAWDAVPWQGLDDLTALGLTEEMVSTAAYWTDGGVVAGGGPTAISAALRTHRGWRRALGVLLDLPPLRPLGRAVYGVVARNRHAMPGGTDACRLPPPA